jgi:hypothetical protein
VIPQENRSTTYDFNFLKERKKDRKRRIGERIIFKESKTLDVNRILYTLF